MTPALLSSLERLVQSLREADDFKENLIASAHAMNPFFTRENIMFAIRTIADNYLDREKLFAWFSAYDLTVPNTSMRIGIIMPGNIPLVGFHDLLCVMISGHKPVVKVSHRDSVLMRYVIEQWNAPLGEPVIEIADRLTHVDAVIATGGDNSARYFEYHFGKLPHIFRKNRNGVAVLSGNESQEELTALADDIFLYFGLGCRNVSKVFLPAGYDPSSLLQTFSPYEHALDCIQYRHNLEYQLAMHRMNEEPFHSNGFVVMKESQQLASPIAVLHYQFYHDLDQLVEHLEENASHIQCVVSHCDIEAAIPFGSSQRPRLTDYADGIDTMAWLLGLHALRH